MANGFINEKTTHYPSLKNQLLMQRGSQALIKFDTLNSHLRRSMVTPGQLVIVPDDSTAVILFPRMFIWRGLVTQQELDAIPQGLKRWSKAPLYLELPLFFGMIAFWIWHPFQ
ncbi:hypothetical protein [Pseudomonas gingeri]|uniref:hypothetical protein n=1 Tax=Pseudomonas gingeri TaxID=117681 RepID=UPI0015A02A32|nr:hypothetical protein [Pseudomonas gingeri]NWE46312.1 hypothetical protein [Pseudomonas gingeri]